MPELKSGVLFGWLWREVWIGDGKWVVYAEHFLHKEKKEFKKQRAEDYKKQSEDPAAKFSVLVRAKTAKKKIATIVHPISASIPH